MIIAQEQEKHKRNDIEHVKDLCNHIIIKVTDITTFEYDGTQKRTFSKIYACLDIH